MRHYGKLGLPTAQVSGVRDSDQHHWHAERLHKRWSGVGLACKKTNKKNKQTKTDALVFSLRSWRIKPCLHIWLYFTLETVRSVISCSKARVSSACFWLCSAIFSLNFLGLEALLEPGDPDIMRAARVSRPTSQQKKPNVSCVLAVKCQICFSFPLMTDIPVSLTRKILFLLFGEKKKSESRKRQLSNSPQVGGKNFFHGLN